MDIGYNDDAGSCPAKLRFEIADCQEFLAIEGVKWSEDVQS